MTLSLTNVKWTMLSIWIYSFVKMFWLWPSCVMSHGHTPFPHPGSPPFLCMPHGSGPVNKFWRHLEGGCWGFCIPSVAPHPQRQGVPGCCPGGPSKEGGWPSSLVGGRNRINRWGASLTVFFWGLVRVSKAKFCLLLLFLLLKVTMSQLLNQTEFGWEIKINLET